jgi:hypothetical protein
MAKSKFIPSSPPKKEISMSGLDTVYESVLAESLQDARALQRAAQHDFQTLRAAAVGNFLSLNHQANLRALQHGYDNAEVAAAYRGSHLKSGSEVDAGEVVSQGHQYKSESLASFPQTQAQHSAQLLDLDAKIASLATIVGQLAKVMQTTPPQSGGHSAQAPSDREK